MSHRFTRRIGLSVASALFVVGLAVPAAGHAAVAERASLVATTTVDSGSLLKDRRGSYRLTLNLGAQTTQVRSVENDGLLGAKPLSFKQDTGRYVQTWRSAFEGDSRSAVIAIKAGRENLSLKLSNPRLNRAGSKISFTARKRALPGGPFVNYRGKRLNRITGGFGAATLRLSDNGWTKITAHLNAYGSNGGCDGGYSDAVFSCHSTAEGGGTEPFRGVSWFGSTGGGKNVYATGNGVLTQWSSGARFAVSGKLVGVMDNWGSDAFVVNDKSTYAIDGFQCDKHPSSGTDRKLTGKPGGPLHMDLNSAGDVFTGTGYALDIQGYLSESFFAQAKCGS